MKQRKNKNKNLTLSNEIANMVNIDPCATTNSTNGTVLPVFLGLENDENNEKFVKNLKINKKKNLDHSKDEKEIVIYERPTKGNRTNRANVSSLGVLKYRIFCWNLFEGKK